MHALAVLTAIATAVSAQTVTSSTSLASASGSSNATSATSGPVTHTVAVAKGGPSYSPDVVVAEVGDTIEFQFYPTNHSVIRAAYGYPCVPYEMVMGAGHYGFYSGFEPVDVVLNSPPTWSVRVNDTDPIFYYCGAPNSCIGNGMIGVINPNASTSLEHQRQLAESSSFMLLPGEDWPSEGSIPSGVATTSSTSATPTPTAATTVTATPIASSSSHGLGGGAIAGIAVGAAVVLVAAGAAIWFCGYKSRQPSGPAPGTAPQEIHPAYAPMAAAMYGKPGHMSAVSGYGMPPGYGDPHQGLRSPVRHSVVPGTPVEPVTDPHQSRMMHSGSASPNLPPVAPAYGQGPVANLLAVGTHNIAPVEMDSNRHSLEKQGVERYS